MSKNYLLPLSLSGGGGTRTRKFCETFWEYPYWIGQTLPYILNHSTGARVFLLLFATLFILSSLFSHPFSECLAVFPRVHHLSSFISSYSPFAMFIAI